MGHGMRTRDERRKIANRISVFSGIILKRIYIMGYRRSSFEWGITCREKSNFGNPNGEYTFCLHNVFLNVTEQKKEKY